MYKQPEREHDYTEEDIRNESKRRDFSRKQKKGGVGKIITFLVIAILIAGGVLVKLWLDTDPFVKPGEVSIDDSVSETNRNIINENIEKWKNSGNKIRHDIKYSEKTVYSMAEAGENDVLVKIELPTVDFYDSELNISSSEAESESSSKKITWVDFINITPEARVVSIDDNYFFDNIEKGGKYTYISYETDNSEKSAAIWIATADQNYDQKYPESSKDFLSFAQTGVTALTRAMTLTLNGKAGGRGSYFADKIKDFLSSKDLTHISNEVSFTDGCKGSTGTMSLCADWRSLDSITAIGTDIVELTGNHNNNYGTSNNIKTIEKYEELGMKTVGGGKTEEEAAKPLELDEKGNKITLLAYNHSTSTKGNGELADGNRPGANGFTEEKAKKDIKEAKERGDFIIVDIQYSECYSYPDGYTEMPSCDKPISGQKNFFRQFIDWGADVVIGTQAHHPQTFELYEGKPIYYGLGNLFFDQTYWPGTQRGYILTHYFYNGKLLNTRISPTWYDASHQVYLTDESTSEKFIKRLMEASPKGK
ncbi:CapA family protein [Candidatus Saccharibacteria bacterium]|nr:CapA family protein [Candidatus Saccharibacteria bacterium]